MVLDDELRPLHKLTSEGEDAYRDFLERKADEILFKHGHPFKWIIQKAKELMQK